MASAAALLEDGQGPQRNLGGRCFLRSISRHGSVFYLLPFKCAPHPGPEKPLPLYQIHHYLGLGDGAMHEHYVPMACMILDKCPHFSEPLPSSLYEKQVTASPHWDITEGSRLVKAQAHKWTSLIAWEPSLVLTSLSCLQDSFQIWPKGHSTSFPKG